MYGDTGAIRKRAAQLYEQGDDIRRTAETLVSRTESVAWTGRAAQAMRDRIQERASDLRDTAAGHDRAADALQRHGTAVDTQKQALADRERRALELVAGARARLDSGATEPGDEELVAFRPPPSGHLAWLSVELPGL